MLFRQMNLRLNYVYSQNLIWCWSKYLKSITYFDLSTLPIWRIVCLGFSCLKSTECSGFWRLCVFLIKALKSCGDVPWVWAESFSPSFVFLDLFFLCLWSPTHAAWRSNEKERDWINTSFRSYTNESPWDLLCCNVVSLSIAPELDPYSQANQAVVY